MWRPASAITRSSSKRPTCRRKVGGRGLTTALAFEWGQLGIRVAGTMPFLPNVHASAALFRPIVASSASHGIANSSLPIIRRIVSPTLHGRATRRLDAELPRASDIHLANPLDRPRLPNLDVEPPNA